MSFEIKPATRVGVNPLIVAYSESGCGKTMSALLLARGLAGPSGKIVVADSESRRASLYADVIPGGFDAFDLAAPFTPARYIEAIDAIEESGATVGIIDSGSHQWEGAGGVLDMAAENETRSGKPGLHNWRQPKFQHALFVNRLLRIKIPFIICLRAKYKSRQIKDDKGKTVIVKDDTTSPIQAEDFIFESTCHFEILPKHNILLTKCSHPSLRDCFPKEGPITIQHGELIAKWCAAAGTPKPAPVADDKKSASLVELQTKLWKILAGIRTPGKKGWDEVNNWLAVNKIITASQSVTGMNAEQIEDAIGKAKVVLSEQQEAGLL